MASQADICRLCCSNAAIRNKNYRKLFNSKSMEQDLPGRLSRTIDLPVNCSDGLSKLVCFHCLKKVESFEAFKALARQSYQKQGYKEPLPVDSSPVREGTTTRKRPKDTCGTGASPFTVQSRPSAKKSTGGVAGRRLAFTPSQCSQETSLPDTAQLIATTQESGNRSDATQVAPGHPANEQNNSMQRSSTEADISHQGLVDHQTESVASSAPRKSVMITINSTTRSSPVTIEVEERFHKIAQTVAGQHSSSIAKAVLAESSVRAYIIERVITFINDECSAMCSTSTQPVSLFRNVSFQPLPSFTWRQCIQELQAKCPTLYQLLWAIVSRSDHRNRVKQGDQHFPGICVAMAILLKERNKHMSGIQTLLSLVLYSSRVQKKVYTRLNHIGVAVSYPTVLAMITKISEQHKAPIEEWVKEGLAFQFVGDNVAKQKGVRDVRSNHHGELVHMYSLLAVKARVPPPHPFADFSPPDLSLLKSSYFLPTEAEVWAIRANLKVIVARVLTKYIKALQNQKRFVTTHISHVYSKEMAMRSDIVVVDVLHKCETKRTDMIDIMREMMGYIGDSEVKRLSMGDLVTKERQDGAKRHVICGNTPNRRLEMLVPCVADWHCMLNFLEHIWKIMYKKSSTNRGTLMNLLNRVGRLKDAKKPKKNLHACLDGLLTIFKGHLVAAACRELGIGNPMDDLAQPSEGSRHSKVDVSEVAMRVVDRWTIVPEAILGQHLSETSDGVYNYARVLCHLAALVTEFTDAWSEGDGPRIIRCWKVMMLHFFAKRNTKYSLEALRLQCDLASLPPYLVHQLTWGRTVNTHGGAGHNIPCDLQNEHVNRHFKEIIGDMGANFTKEASTRTARSISTLVSTAELFDKVTGIHPGSTAHTTKSDTDDVLAIVKDVLMYKVLTVVDNRQHTSFPDFSVSPLKTLNRKHLEEWIKDKVKSHNTLLACLNEDQDSDEDSEEDVSGEE